MKKLLLKPLGLCLPLLFVMVLLLNSFAAFAQPPNNNCASRIALTVNCTPLNLQNIKNATNSYTLSSCGNTSSPDMYYSFVATKTTAVIKLSNFSNLLSANMRLEVFSACPLGGTVLICGTTPLYVSQLIVGTTYIIRVSTSNLTSPTTTDRTFGIAVCDNFAIDFSKSYINISDGNTGGTINPGDTVEIRGTFVVNGDNSVSVSGVSFFDTLRLGGGLNLGSPLATRTNEGKIFNSFTTSALDADAGGVTLTGLDTAIRINLGTGATASAGGTLTSASLPSFYGGTNIIMATYRVRVNAIFGKKINIGGGAFRYSIGNNNYVIAFPADSLIVYQNFTACSDAVSPGNLIGSANNGTFGTLPIGTNPFSLQNAGPAIDINTTYGYQPFGVGPNDYFYARANNTSSNNTIVQSSKPNGTTRVFGIWDITGDHTGSIDPQKGNKPCNPNQPVSDSNPCGYLLAVNAAYRSDVVFEYNVTGACSETYYEVSAWFKNLCYKCGCDVNGNGANSPSYIPTSVGDSSGVRPNIAMKIDGIHYYTTGDLRYQGLGLPRTSPDSTNNWVRRSFVFRTSPNQTNFKITFANNAPGGGGNDWAIDDIELRTCYPDMIYAPPNPIAFVGSPLTLSDTIRSYFDSYRHWKWQRRPVATGVWTDIPSANGIGSPVLVGSTYDYVVYYTIPGTATLPINSGDLYRVVVASNLVNLSNGCNYSPDVSFGLYPVNAPCNFSDTNRAIVPINTTINWNKLDWSLGHIPTCCESAQITYASGKPGATLGNVEITNDICIINLTLINSSTQDLQLFKTVLNIGYNMYMRGHVRMQATGTFVADSSIFIARGNNTINIDGNTEIGKPGDNAYSVFGTEPGVNAYANYIMAGDSLTINSRGLINHKLASVMLNPTSGAARLVNNTNTSPYPNAVTFDRLIIGNSNAKTVTVEGTNQNSFLNDNGGYLDVSLNSTLIMPANYTLNAKDFSSVGVYNSQLFLRSGSNLNLGGSTGGIPGSNFPRFFNTYTLLPTSTVLFNGTVAQSMPGVVNNINSYGHITLAGTGLKTASAGNTILAGNFYRRNGGHTFNSNKGRFTFTSSVALQRYYADAGTSVTNFYDFTNNNTNAAGLSIDSTIGIVNECQLNPNSRFTLNTGDVIMRSSDSLTSHITNLGVTIPSITYNTTYRFQIERYLYGVKAWRFLATPVLDSTADITSPITGASWRENYAALTSNGYGTAITGATATLFGATGAFDYQSPFPSMKYYNAGTNSFIGITDARNYKLANSAGYMLFVRGDRGAANVLNPSVLGTATTLRMKGKIRTANQSFTVAGLGVQSVGNPYASQINFATVSKVGLVDGFVVWNPTLYGNFGVGGYQNYVKVTTNYRLNGLATGAIRNTIESGEAFFIQTITAGTKTMTIAESDKGILSSLVSRQAEEHISIPTLDVELYQKNLSDEALLIDGVSTSFDNRYSAALDNDDAYKFINSYNNLFIPNGGKRLVVEKRPAIKITDTVNLAFTGLSVLPHSFKITPFQLSSTGLDAYLLDRFQRKEIELSLYHSTEVDFEITADAASRAQNRFSIIFKKSENNFTSIVAKRNADKSVTVNWGIENERSAKDYILEHSLDGINFSPLASKTATNNSGGNPTYSYMDEAAARAANWYRVKAEFIGRSDKYTSIANVLALPEEIGNNKSSINISPNPIVGNTINLLFKNMPVGNYDLKISNASGQVMFTTTVNIQMANVTKNINLNKLASGIYQAVILDKNGKQQVLSLIVQ